MKKKKKVIIIVSSIIGILLILVVINFIPTFSLKTSNMSVLHGAWVDVYYETEEEAAKDVFEYVNVSVEGLAKKLGFDKKQDVCVYIYDSGKTMQMKKYGIIGRLLKLDWYVGDNIGTDVIMTSPANPGKVHDYDTIKNETSLHEIVHAYISVINKDVALWLTEGVAGYLTDDDKYKTSILKIDKDKDPSYEDTISSNPIRFADCAGYTFAPSYIEYIDKTYGWGKVLELIKTNDYEKTFDKSQKKIYDEWIVYIDNFSNIDAFTENSTKYQ